MAKITLPTIASGYASITQLNSAFDSIEQEFNNKVLYRDNPTGEANQMEVSIDMNNNSITNVDGISTETITVDGIDLTAQITASQASSAAAAASATAAANSASSASGSASTATTGASTATTQASNASTSASAASTSASNAATSASAAATSATNAANSATAAQTAETNAETAETNAAASEAQVATDAASAATSASQASTSATNAASSASSASTSATNAASSASSASTSATSASGSATTATTQATNASNSASAASTSATNAASSASSASTSASTATTQATNASSSATAAQSAQTAAESARDSTLAAFDSFDDRYLGAKASDPSVDNDGNALIAGALYFNSSSGVMKLYTGSAWVAAYVSGTGFVAQTSITGSADIPTGTTGERDGSPSAGYFRFNTTTGTFEGHNGSAWGSVGGGATGAGGDTVFSENSMIVTTSYTLTSGKSASSVGPITINSGATVTIPSGSRWVII
jgi:hypothetical protein